jgi:cytochrome c oxidase subunit 2
MVVVGAIASAIGIALGLLIDWFPEAGATQAGPIDTLYDVLVIVSVPVFVLVTVVILFAAWRFRVRPGQENEDGPPIHGNTRLEVVWTAIPAILLVSLCSYAYAVLVDIEEKHADQLVVEVSAQQFAWRYSYPQEGGARPIQSTLLYLPKDQPVLFKVRAEDVIHDFWVPAFRVKIDAVPGIVTEVRATPNRIGRFPVVCAELCGLGHSTMRSTAVVVSPEDFDRWLARAAEGGTTGSGGAGGAGAGASEEGPATDEDAGSGDPIALGKETFTATCGGCHTLTDAGTTGTTGPDLDTALRGQSEDEIRTDIVDPDARVEEGYQPGIMPGDYGDTLSAEQLDGLVAYLASVAR